jgi:hypothetical protein
MERNEQDRILALAEDNGVQPEWTDYGDGTGELDFSGSLDNFVSFAEAYTGMSQDPQDVYYNLVRIGFQEDLVEDETEFTGTPDAFWGFVGSLN